jgi:hypothetical protein
MTDGYPPSTPYPAGDRPPFDPFVLEPQKAHNSTGSPAPAHPGRRRLRIPGPLLGLLLALAVAVPVIAGTLQPSGQDSADVPTGAAGGDDGQSAPARPDTGSEQQDEPTPPPSLGAPEEAPAPPLDPPSTAPGAEQLGAIEDCLENALGLRAACDALGTLPQAAERYLDCREVGLAADRCLEALPPE